MWKEGLIVDTEERERESSKCTVAYVRKVCVFTSFYNRFGKYRLVHCLIQFIIKSNTTN